MIHEPFRLADRTFDLSHLAPRELLCPRTDGAQDIRISVAFSHHTYTAEEKPDALLEPFLRFYRHRERRYFSEARWHQSVTYLPGMVNSLPQARVEFAFESRNFRYAVGSLITPGMDYGLYFTLKRSPEPGIDLALFVESAYPAPPASRRRDHIRFLMLAEKVLRGEKVTRPPRR